MYDTNQLQHSYISDPHMVHMQKFQTQMYVIACQSTEATVHIIIYTSFIKKHAGL